MLSHNNYLFFIKTTMDFQFQPKQFTERTEKTLLKQQIEWFLFMVNVFVNKIIEVTNWEVEWEDIETLKRDLQSVKDRMDTMTIEELKKTIFFLDETLQHLAMAFWTLLKELRVINPAFNWPKKPIFWSVKKDD